MSDTAKPKPIPSIIPTQVFNNQNLSDGAKVFYGVIIYLARESGRAFAKTHYLAEQLGRSTRSIQLYISELYDKRLIDIEIKNGQRNMYPLILPKNSLDIASYIPPEVVKNNKLSASVKLTYGLIQYRSANKNGYFAYDGIDTLVEMTSKSRSTMYRHLSIYKQFGLVEYKKADRYTQVYTFNTYQDAFKIKNEAVTYKQKMDPPDKENRPVKYQSSITPKEADYLRALVGR